MNKRQGASWSEEFDYKELHGALGGERDLEDALFPGTPSIHLPSPSTTVWYADFRGCVWLIHSSFAVLFQ